MSTEPVAPRGKGAIAAILLFPLRAVERARGWQRLALLLLYVMIALPILAPLWRRSQLAGLPDVGTTFEVTDARPAARVPDDRNAFVAYRRAAERFREMSDDEEESFSRADLRWSRTDAVLRGWVAEHREAVSLLRAGSERPEAYLERPGHTDVLAIAAEQEVIQRLSWIANAALFEAGRLRAEGDPAGAWALLKAVVRASRDMERAVPTAWCQRTAMTLVQYAHGPVAEWAKDPSVNVALLRQGPRRPDRRRGTDAAPVVLLPGRISGRGPVAGVPANADRRAGPTSRRCRHVRPVGLCPEPGCLPPGRARAESPGAPPPGRERPGLVRPPGVRAASAGGAPAADLPGRPIHAAGRPVAPARGTGPVGRVGPDPPRAALADGRPGGVGPVRSPVAGPAQGRCRRPAIHPGDGPPARLVGRGPAARSAHSGRLARSR